MNTATTRNYVVSAIDIGYGNVKLISKLEGNKPVCKNFDSIAVLADNINRSLARYCPLHAANSSKKLALREVMYES